MISMDILPLLLAVITGAVYGGLWYYDKTLGQDPEKFDWIKFTATLLVSAAVGAVLQLAGSPITQQSLELQITAYGFYIIVTEKILKILYKKAKEWGWFK